MIDEAVVAADVGAARTAQRPAARARVDIAEHDNGCLELLRREQVLRRRAFLLHEHLRAKGAANGKTLDARVDALVR